MLDPMAGVVTAVPPMLMAAKLELLELAMVGAIFAVTAVSIAGAGANAVVGDANPGDVPGGDAFVI